MQISFCKTFMEFLETAKLQLIINKNMIPQINNPPGSTTADNFTIGYLLMHNAQYTDALLFWSSQDKGNAAVQYNTALCHFFAKEYSFAKENIENSIRNIRISNPIQRNAAINNLLEIEAQSDNYLNPLISASLNFCPELVLLRANRLLYDICLQLGDTQTAQRIASTLANKHFSNVK